MRHSTHRPTAPAALVALAAVTALSGCARAGGAWGGALGEPAGAASPVPSVSSATPNATASSSPTPSSSPKPSSTPTTNPSVPEPSPTPSNTATATPQPPPALRYGDSGPEVLALQQRLAGLGYWLGHADGRFGRLTQQAVFALQKSAGLSRDGIVGPKTRAALTAGPRPQATLSGSGIEIDLDRQILMVVREGAPTVILNTSTGSGEQYTSEGHTSTAYTPTGTFTVFRQVDGQDDGPLGELWRPKYFYRGWAVHGSPSVPPYPASHGCARLSDAAIDMIWAQGLMPIGTRVLVR
jgi:peptidoglycan hydrolase-like protein with peptidoglycan-binding domain